MRGARKKSIVNIQPFGPQAILSRKGTFADDNYTQLRILKIVACNNCCAASEKAKANEIEIGEDNHKLADTA